VASVQRDVETTWKAMLGSRVLAVVAHPDDESFGLGALLAAMTASGTDVSLLCFTRGEASTLGDPVEDLGALRAEELASAADRLGLTRTELLDYPDSGLARVSLSELVEHVERQLALSCADTLLVFDEGGITGHPDHCQATAAALEAADRHDLVVVAWSIPQGAAAALNAEFGTSFIGRQPREIDIDLPVERDAQRKAIGCHNSQATENEVLWRRLELLGNHEHIRYLRRSRRWVGPSS
jgi:LmbE family N-acetylglucosaminyl deacetylase